MVLFDFVHHLLSGLVDLAVLKDLVQEWVWHSSSVDWSLLAQEQFNTDVFASFRNFLDNFIKSGQAWALLIGLLIGYVLRGLTTYG